MNKSQVAFLKQLNQNKGDGTPAASSVHYMFEQNLTLRNENDYVFFDDTHELVHAICANADSTTKQGCPFSLFSFDYNQLIGTQSNLTIDDLKYLLNGMLSGYLTSAQKDTILNWANNLPVNPISTVIGNYIKKAEVKVEQKPIKPENYVRSDGKTSPSYPVTYND